jgi:uncharacterized protein YwgA
MTSQFGQDHVLTLIGHLGTVRGRKRLQKLLYFLQEAERVPLGLDFSMHHYGPYSRLLDARLAALRLASVVRSSSTLEGVMEFRLSAEAEHDVRSARTTEEPSIKRVGSLAKLMPNEIELLATVHYLLKDAPTREASAIHRLVKAWKGDKYSLPQVRDAVQQLDKMGYLS